MPKKRYINHKSQSSIEFLMTYGWYILIAVIILSIMFYFGFFQSKIISEVNIEYPLEILDFQITESSVDFMIKASPEVESAKVIDITVNDISCKRVQIGQSEIYNPILNTDIRLSGCQGMELSPNQKIVGEIIIEYKKEKGVSHKIIGDYVGRVESSEQMSCGNGNREITFGEECDDGNLKNGDGCSSTCKITHKICEEDSCISVFGAGSNQCSSSLNCMIICNHDGTIDKDKGEQCDCGIDEICTLEELDYTTCADYELEQGEVRCNNCILDNFLCHTCGNEIIEGNEECDTYNLGYSDGTCASLGLLGGEISCYLQGTPNECNYNAEECGYCGDHSVTSPEECDFDIQGNPILELTCQEKLGPAYSGSLNCAPIGNLNECQYDYSTCEMVSCGNNEVQEEYGEECDFNTQGNPIFGPSFPEYCNAFSNEVGSYQDGQLGCDSNICKIDTSNCHTCGDDVVEGPEECDNENLNNKYCTDIPGFNGGRLLCYPFGIPNQCTFYTEDCIQSCGNGIPEPQYGEECDDGNEIAMDGCNNFCQITHNECNGITCIEVIGQGTTECLINEDLFASLRFDEGGDSQGSTTPNDWDISNQATINENTDNAIAKKSNCKYSGCYQFERGNGNNNGYIELLKTHDEEAFSFEAWIMFPKKLYPLEDFFILFSIGDDIRLGFNYHLAQPYLRSEGTKLQYDSNDYDWPGDGVGYGPVYNNWYHYAFTCGQKGKSVYINGELLDRIHNDNTECYGNRGLKFTIGNLFEGNSDTKGTFDGYVDNAIIYNRELTQSEIQKHINQESDSCIVVF